MYGAPLQAESITIHPLDAKLNPFRKDYDPWDEWIYQHAVTCTDPAIENYFRGAGSRGNLVLDAFVDSSGFLVPQSVAEMRRLHANAAGGDDEKVYLAQWSHRLYAAGLIDPQLLSSYRQAMLGLRAEYVLKIPAWLAANPPAWAMILPPEAGKHAGEVVMYDKPGLDQDYALPPGEIRPPTSRAVYFRYSTAGKLLGQTRVGQHWWELYTSNPAAPDGPGSSSHYRVFEAVGIVSVIDVRTSKRAWLMDFTGQRIADTKHPQPRNANHWLGLTAQEIKAVYALQQGGAPATPARVKPKPKSGKPLGGSRS